MKQTNFRKIIRELIKSGDSPALLAHECGCSETYIKQLLAGYRKSPSYDIGRKLSERHEAIE